MERRRAFLTACKKVGLFDVARRLTRHSLRILGYHAFSATDESEFRPMLFMRPETFQSRLALLRRLELPLLSLEEASERLRRRSLPDAATVITIDDGHASTAEIGAAMQAASPFPATIYVTTYYVTHQQPVLDVALAYLFFKTKAEEIDLTGLDLPPSLPARAAIADDRARRALAARIVAHGRRRPLEKDRAALARGIAERLGLSWTAVGQLRTHNLMSESEIRSVLAAGFDVQLHTHRHRFPECDELLAKEITDNRAVLEPLSGKRLRHLCYPSGEYRKSAFDVLARLGIETAVTCERGLTSWAAHPFELPRILDSEAISEIEIEAELTGFLGLLRAGHDFGRQRPRSFE